MEWAEFEKHVKTYSDYRDNIKAEAQRQVAKAFHAMKAAADEREALRKMVTEANLAKVRVELELEAVLERHAAEAAKPPAGWSIPPATPVQYPPGVRTVPFITPYVTNNVGDPVEA